MRDQIGVKGAVATYLGLVLAISGIFYFLIIHGGRLDGGRNVFVTGLMWSPGLAALLTVAILRRPVSSLGWAWGRIRYQILSYLIPPVYGAITYGVAWATGLAGCGNSEAIASIARDYGWEGLPTAAVIAGYVILQATVNIIPACARALGEEIGWRGFLVPELARTLSFTQVSIISGLAWAAWHYPILLFADYNSGTPAWYALTCFTIEVVAFSFVFAWLRLRSGNLWTATILHGSHNLFIQTVFDEFTSDTGRTAYVTGEFGAALAITFIVAAAIAWRARRLVESAAQAPADLDGRGASR